MILAAALAFSTVVVLAKAAPEGPVPGTFRVMVVDTRGNPVPGVTLWPPLKRGTPATSRTPRARGPLRESASVLNTGGDGRAGDLSIAPQPDDIVFYARDDRGREGTGGGIPGAAPTNITITIARPSTLTVLVTDTAGAPVRGATVDLHADGAEFAKGHHFVAEDLVASSVTKVFDGFVTDDSGAVRVPLRFFGDYAISVHAPGPPHPERAASVSESSQGVMRR